MSMPMNKIKKLDPLAYLILLSCLPFAIYFYRFFEINFFLVNFPVFDHWRMMAETIDSSKNNLTLSFFFSPIMEHRLPLIRSYLLIDYSFFNFNFNFMRVNHWVSFFLLLAFTIWQFTKITIDFNKYKLFLNSLIITSCILFLLSIRAWEVHYGFMNPGTIQCYLLFMLACFFYNKRCDLNEQGNKVSYLNLLLIISLCLLSEFSMAFGLLALPLILLNSILRASPKSESLLLFIASIFCFFIYSVGIDEQIVSGSFFNINLNEVKRILYFCCLTIGSIFTIDKSTAFAFGLPGILFSIILLTYLFFFVKKKSSIATITASMLMFTLGYVLLAAIARRSFIEEQAMVSRYMLTSGIFWSSLYTLALYFSLKIFSRSHINVLLVFSFLTLILSVHFSLFQKSQFKNFNIRYTKDSAAVKGLQAGLYDPETFSSLQIRNDEYGKKEFLKYLKVYWDNKTSIYAESSLDLIGQNINTLFSSPQRNCDIGMLKIITTDKFEELLGVSETDLGIKVSGNIGSNELLYPANIFVVDKNGIIKGQNVLSHNNDLNTRTLDRVDWFVFAYLTDSRSQPLSLYIERHTNYLCRLNLPAVSR